MDADYGRILDKDGKRIDQGEWENALFILTSVMSHAKADKAIVDAGLKAQSVDSGLPVVFGRTDVKYLKCSDEHGVVEDRAACLKVNDKLRLVPGHCDPTCNVHDWYVGVRGGKVEVGLAGFGARQGLLTTSELLHEHALHRRPRGSRLARRCHVVARQSEGAPMLIVPEALIASLVSPEDAFAAVEACFASMARGEA